MSPRVETLPGLHPCPHERSCSRQSEQTGQGQAGAGAPAGHTRWRSDIGQSSELLAALWPEGLAGVTLRGKQVTLDLTPGLGLGEGHWRSQKPGSGSGALSLPLVTPGHPRGPKRWGLEQWQWEGQRDQRCCVGMEVRG